MSCFIRIPYPASATAFNTSLGVLTLTGEESAANYQEALRRVEYNNLKSTLFEGNRTIVFNAGDSDTFLSETEHFYEFIEADGITWYEANTASTQRYYFGCQGYLMTVTSAAENAFAVSQLGGARGWMGAGDVESNKVWKWLCGPEKGLHFFTQTQDASGCGVGGTNVPGQYSNWDKDEPNDWSGGCEHGEDFAHFLQDGTWNDYAFDNKNIDGYIVEYGGRTNDPPLHFADSATVQVRSANHPPDIPVLITPGNCPDLGSTGPPDDDLNTAGRTQNPRPKLIWRVPLDDDNNKLNFKVWYESGNSSAGAAYEAFSASSVTGFTYYSSDIWTNFPFGGVTNYDTAWVGYVPQSDVCAGYTDIYWKVCAYDGVTDGTTSSIRRFLCGGRTWTDNPLPAQGTFRDDYIIELREEADYALLFRNTPAKSWTDPTLTPGSTSVRDEHIMELRAAVAQVTTNTGEWFPSTNWTDHPIIPFITPMKKQHISELRDAIESL